jgi:hypothetical protein
VLYAVVTEFIATAEPVGSRTLTRKYGFSLSAATIRNELADLEESGYLAQPHTSAGRVPTEAAFRIFVDALMQVREVSQNDATRIKEYFGELNSDSDIFARDRQALVGSERRARGAGARAYREPHLAHAALHSDSAVRALERDGVLRRHRRKSLHPRGEGRE